MCSGEGRLPDHTVLTCCSAALLYTIPAVYPGWVIKQMTGQGGSGKHGKPNGIVFHCVQSTGVSAAKRLQYAVVT